MKNIHFIYIHLYIPLFLLLKDNQLYKCTKILITLPLMGIWIAYSQGCYTNNFVMDILVHVFDAFLQKTFKKKGGGLICEGMSLFNISK